MLVLKFNQRIVAQKIDTARTVEKLAYNASES